MFSPSVFVVVIIIIYRKYSPLSKSNGLARCSINFFLMITVGMSEDF